MDNIDDKKLQTDIADVLQNNGVDKWSINIRKEPIRVKLPQNVMVFQTFSYMAAVKLKPSALRILNLLYAISEYENYIQLHIESIMDDLAISKPTVIEGLKQLVEYNIIQKVPHPTDKRQNDYFINPNAMWKGNGQSRLKMLSELNKRQLLMFPEPPQTPTE